MQKQFMYCSMCVHTCSHACTCVACQQNLKSTYKARVSTLAVLNVHVETAPVLSAIVILRNRIYVTGSRAHAANNVLAWAYMHARTSVACQ